MNDYLDLYPEEINTEAVRALRNEPQRILASKGNAPLCKVVEDLPAHKFSDNDFSSPVVRFGKSDDLSDSQRAELKDQLMQLIPWRKGPFEIGGLGLDAEWRSERKWDKLEDKLPNLRAF